MNCRHNIGYRLVFVESANTDLHITSPSPQRLNFTVRSVFEVKLQVLFVFEKLIGSEENREQS